MFRFGSIILNVGKVYSPQRFLKNYKLNLKTNESIYSYQLTSSRKMATSNLQTAADRLKTLKDDPGNDVKLKLYALYKQATEGKCSKSKPSAFDFVGKAKWEAWNSLGAMTKDEAQNKYVSLVDELCSKENVEESPCKTTNSKYEGIDLTVESDITTITFCRPNKKNAITRQMYKDITLALRDASQNGTAVTIITGEGDYYSSGNDLSNFSSAAQGDLETAAKDGAVLLKEFVAAFIDFPNVLVGAVNGPAIGIPVTLLGLFDVVYASNKATFQTPFSLLGQSPEGCATYTFPRIMGPSKANEMLMFNKKLTASEAKDVGLVTEVFPHATFMADVKKQLEFLPSASKQSMIHTKDLIRKREKDILHAVNAAECERLVERWQSQDCMEAIMRFFQKKSKM